MKVFKKMFENQAEISQITRFVNERTLYGDYGKDQMDRFEEIRNILIQRRKRKKIEE